MSPSFIWSLGLGGQLIYKEAPHFGVKNLVCLRMEVTNVWRQQVKKKTINSLIWAANRKGSIHIYIKTIL